MLELAALHNKHRLGHSLMSLGLILTVASSMVSGALQTRVKAIGVSEVNNLSNQQRSANGLTPFTLSDKLSSAAQAKANHMVSNSYFAHTAPDGTTGWYFIAQQSYAYSSAGENLAATNQTSSDVVNGWMNSAGHRANLLNTTFTEVGYGVAYIGDWNDYTDITFVVALYAKPQAAKTQTAAPSTPSATPTATAPATSSQPATAAPTDASTDDDEIETTPATTDDKPPTKTEQVSGLQVQADENSGLSERTRNVMVYGAFGFAIALVACGFYIELRRFLHHSKIGITHHVHRV